MDYESIFEQCNMQEKQLFKGSSPIYKSRKCKICGASGENIKFHPETTIELSDRIQVTLDLLVEIYEDGKLSQVNIWDWKMEKRKILKSFAKTKMQTIVYMYACKESIAKDLDYSNLKMYYYQARINNNVMIEYTEKDHEKNRETIYSLINKIKSISKEVE